MRSSRGGLLLLGAAGLGAAAGAGEARGECLAGAAACRAPAAAAAAARQHPWPYVRGPADSYGVTRQRTPHNLSASLAWSWHDPRGRFATVLNGGLVIDDGLNVYTAAIDGIHKLSPDGRLLWTTRGDTSGAPVLVGDTLYGDSKDGHMFALDLETGARRWATKVAANIGSDCHSVGVGEGVMVTAAEGNPDGGSRVVHAVNATSGNALWAFHPQSQLWNFMPMFTGNGTFLFQDQVGRAYHLNLTSGEVVWRSAVLGGFREYWTDGMSWLGPNGLFYAVHVHALDPTPTTPSDLRAYRVADGGAAWSRDFPYPINSQPVVARLRKGEGFSLVMCSGLQAGVPLIFVLILVVQGTYHLGVLVAAPALAVCVARNRRVPRWRTCVRLLALVPAVPLLFAVAYGIRYARDMNSRFPSEVQVMDAATGELRWRYTFPDWHGFAVRGDAEGIWERLVVHKTQPFCVPNGWGSPSVDASGTIWLGHQNGLIYGLRDDDGDGRISEAEVSTFDMGASSTHFGGAYAAGVMAWASCDTVFLFRE